MDPIVGVAVLVAVAIGAIGLALVWRQASNGRRRAAATRALDERIAARLADLHRGLSGSGGGPIPERGADDEIPPISEPVPVETEAPSPVLLADVGPTVNDGGGRKRRVIARGAAVVAAVAVVLLLVTSRLPSILLPNATPPATQAVAAVPPTALPNPASATPETSPTSAATATAAPRVTPAVTTAPTPLPTPVIYVVRLGDSMFTIAVTFGVTLEDLIAANPQIRDPSLIYAGNEITIPTPGPSPGASATPSAVP